VTVLNVVLIVEFLLRTTYLRMHSCCYCLPGNRCYFWITEAGWSQELDCLSLMIEPQEWKIVTYSTFSNLYTCERLDLSNLKL
jgi:hypothetical protein